MSRKDKDIALFMALSHKIPNFVQSKSIKNDPA